MNSLKALQAWYDYGVLLHAGYRMRYIDDEELEAAIRVHKKLLRMVEDTHLRAQKEDDDEQQG